MLCLVSIRTDHVLCESCYKVTILQRINKKMTMSWSLSDNSYVKLHGKKIWEPQHDRVIIQSML